MIDSTNNVEALKSQQGRIMKALQATAQPMPGSPDGRNIAQAMVMEQRGQGSYYDNLNKMEANRFSAIQTQNKNAVGAEQEIYNLMRQQVEQGDPETMGIDKAINEVVGNDPAAYVQILGDLHSDPENVSVSNAKMKVMKYAAQRGIVPIDLQEKKAKITKDLKGGDDPAAVREYQYFSALPPEKQKEYIHVKRTGGEEALDVALGKAGAKSYAEEQIKVQEATNFLDNLDVARDRLAKAKMTGPVFGRVGKAASDPSYVDWQGAKNGLTLLAKTIYAMPSANFSDADRDFLDDITGGKFPNQGASEKTIDRLELLANKAIRNSQKNQRDVLTRKTYNKDAPIEDIPVGGTVVTPKVDYKSKYGLE